MSDSLPRVALYHAALSLLDAATVARIDLIDLGDVSTDHSSVDLRGVRFLAPGPRNRTVIDALPGLADLEVVQVSSAGTDWIEGALPEGVTLCNSRGARDAPVSEWLLGALLGVSTHLLERAGARRWERLELRDLADWTVLIVGMGSIGRTLARYLEPIGTSVVGVASRAREDLHGIDELPALLPDADAVILLAPLTEATTGLISTSELEAMRDGAVLINAARGAVIDTDALVEVLARKPLSVILDVTDPEPLPEGHPLWSAPGVLSITPHIAGASPAGHRNAARLAADQLRRWLDGEALLNVVER